ncbi:MAG: PH domain-containing protein [Rikenellaceae bacterium]
MSQKIYKYHSDRKTYITTIIYFAILAIAGLLIVYMYVGGFFSAWFISLVAALIALIVISIPRNIVVDENSLTILCVLEIVEIPINDIASIQKVDNSECRWFTPIIGSRGFFGYFGFYIDLNSLERIRLYATEWQNLVEIIDIYDDRYYISCREAEELITQVQTYINAKEA